MDKKDLFRRALPFWVALSALTALVRAANPTASYEDDAGRLLTGIEPIAILQAMTRRPARSGRIMLCYGLPSLARRAGEQDPLLRQDPDLSETFWRLAVGMRYRSPQEMLRAGLPALGFRPPASVPRVALVGETPIVTAPPATVAEPEPPAPAPQVPAAGGTIIILHTHTSESYLPISGRDHLSNGAGDIVQVGEYLAESLKSAGFEVLHDKTLHDQVPFRDAYRRSLATMRQLLETHPEPLALIDLHRDATPGVAGTVELGGEKVARLVLVVGTDRLGLPHPRWRENLAFANCLRDAAERLYPGLLARIDIADARYNQHLSPRTIIVEVGNQHSTAVEVFRASACLARIMAEAAPALAELEGSN